MALQFSDTSPDKNGLIQECESLVFGDDSYGRISNDPKLKATFTRYINEALNRVSFLIMAADGRWQWDDNNYTDYPIGTTTITAGQKDYQFSVSFLSVIRVELTGSDGTVHLLHPVDPVDIFDTSITTFLNSNGLPKYYDKMANSLFLYPTPDFTLDASLKVWFQRPPSYFTISDTVKQPGFMSTFHRLVALIASRDYAIGRNMPIAKSIGELVTQAEDALAESYALRGQDDHVRLGVRQYNYR